MRQLFLLQSATAFLLQSATILLQSATGITKCDDYYKVRQVLQSATIITKCDSTGPKLRVHARERAKESLGKD